MRTNLHHLPGLRCSYVAGSFLTFGQCQHVPIVNSQGWCMCVTEG
jgi:hypothetical protein